MKLKFEIELPSQLDRPVDGLIVQAFRRGLEAGLENSHELGTGRTYADRALGETYDEGVNLGQALARLYGSPPEIPAGPGSPT